MSLALFLRAGVFAHEAFHTHHDHIQEILQAEEQLHRCGFALSFVWNLAHGKKLLKSCPATAKMEQSPVYQKIIREHCAPAELLLDGHWRYATHRFKPELMIRIYWQKGSHSDAPNYFYRLEPHLEENL